jgi:hypothetical protein
MSRFMWVDGRVSRFDEVGRDVTHISTRRDATDCEIVSQFGKVRIRSTAPRSRWLDTGFSCADTVQRLWVSDGIEIFTRRS